VLTQNGVCLLLKLALFINQEELLAEEQLEEEKNVEDEAMQSQDLFRVSSSLKETAPAAASSQLTPTPDNGTNVWYSMLTITFILVANLSFAVPPIPTKSKKTLAS
jgi:hypothetical protein